MSIRELKIRNFGPFRGEHTIFLSNQIYAVTGQMGDDTTRSNWQGKSSFLEAIAFTLYGTHRHPQEDHWITRGESVGSVAITLDNGLVIERERRKGRSTKVSVVDTTTTLGLAYEKQEGEVAIRRAVGLSREDFFATCYFEQKKMARFILTEPKDRMAILAAWLRLEPLNEAVKIIREYTREAVLALNDLHSRRKPCIDYLEKISGDLGLSVTLQREDGPIVIVQMIVDKLVKVDQAISVTNAELSKLQNERDNVSTFAYKAEQGAIWRQVVAEGKEVAKSLSALNLDGITRLVEEKRKASIATEANASLLHTQYRQCASLASGAFDGQCPIGHMECPAKEQLTERVRNSWQAVATAEEAYSKAVGESREAELALTDAARTRDQAVAINAQLEQLRKRAKELAPFARETLHASDQKEAATLDAMIAEVRSELTSLQGSQNWLRATQGYVERTVKNLIEIDKAIALTNEKVENLYYMSHIFGRNGAQRVIAERALSDIQLRANALLSECGIDLALDVQWSREGTGLATHCEHCGSPYPTSTKVRSCAHCASPRGPNVINRLDINLSSRSGAAEDLAGAAFQLAASAWLREDRVSTWDTLLLDEPLGSLDQSNRQAFVSHLTRMVKGRYGFNQAFIVSHHPSVNDSFPGRIVVIGSEEGSQIRVES